jgi:glycosyltransferase involved in cell wall biosynthesis
VSGRIRITYFINSLEQGGAERQLVELMTRLDLGRYAPSLVLCVDRDHLGYQLPVEAIRHLDAPMFPTPLSVWQLVRVLRALRTELLHTYMGWENIFGRVAARLAGVGAVVSSVRCTQLPRVHVLGERLSHFWSDAVIVNSVGIQEELVRRAGIARERIDVIENGVDLSRFRRLGPAEVERERRVWGLGGRLGIVVPGRISAQKNQLAIVHALGRLKQAGELPPEVLVLFAGRGSPPWYGEKVRALATLSDLGTQVEFLGIVKPIELLMGAADCMLLPSNYEGLPNAVIESMACATPVIVSQAANADQLVTDGTEGLVCEGADEAGIAQTLRRFLGLGPEARRAMGEAGHAHATSRFAVARMARRTMDVYERVLDQRKTSRKSGGAAGKRS